MLKPFVKKLSEVEGYSTGKANYLALDEAETIISDYNRIKKGETSEPGNHPDEEELYIVLSGKAKLQLGDKIYDIEHGNVVYIPRNTFHLATCISDEDFEFICVANWPDKIPGKFK